MAVVALRQEAELPRSPLTTHYCVQSYWRDRDKLARGKLQQFPNMEAALRAGRAQAHRWTAVQIYRVRGNAAVDYWEEPVTLAWHGEAPHRQA